MLRPVHSTPDILVVGMHRSGTSVLTRLLALAGAWVGEPDELLPAHASDNPSGYWERKDVTEAHARFLRGAGFDWDRVAGFSLAGTDDSPRRTLRAELTAILDRVGAHGHPLALKDPRLCLVLPLWLELLPNAACVIAVRDPREIAASIRQGPRGIYASNFLVALWEKYLRSALAALEGRRVVFVSHARLSRSPQAEMGRLLDVLSDLGVTGLAPPPEAGLRDAIDRRLEQSGPLPHIVLTHGQQELHDWLERQSLEPGSVLVQGVPEESLPDPVLAEYEKAIAWHELQARESLTDIVRHETLPLQHLIEARDQTSARERDDLRARIDVARAQVEDRLQRIEAALQLGEANAVQTAETLERLRRGQYLNLLAVHAGASRRRLPRGGVRLRLEPNRHLQQLARHPSTSLKVWGSDGDEPQFGLALPTGKPLAAGWYVLCLEMQSVSGAPPRPRLRADHGAGFNAGESIPLALTPNSLRQRPLLGLARPCHALRLDLTGHSRDEDFLLDEVISLRRISSMEAMLRLGVAAVRRFRMRGENWVTVLREVHAALRDGAAQALSRLHFGASSEARAAGADYSEWIAAHDTLDDAARARYREDIDALPSSPLVSILLPVYNTPERWLRRCLDSVIAQLYPNWELCIANDASTQGQVRHVLDEYAARYRRIKIVHREDNGHISAASNSALELASGEWVALLDHDDELAEHALYFVAKAIAEHAHAALIYSDEDKIREDGTRFDPYFKPDWNPELIRGHNVFSHLGVYRRELVTRVGGFREGYEGSQDYDLLLRCVERVSREQIVHIPRVLYHWRAISGSTALAPQEKDYAHTAARRAITEHLDRKLVDAEALPIENRAGNWRIRRNLANPAPRVSIIIPTRNGGDVLRRCLESLEAKTDYPDFEVLVVNNQSDDPGTLALLETARRHEHRRVLDFNEPFNFSRLNNFAAQHVDGDVLLFLNDDTEVINPDWLREMASLAAAPDIGAVGAMLYYPDNTIQHAGIVLGLGKDRIAGHAYHGLPRGFPGDKCRAQLVQEMSAVTAACLAVRHARFDAVGGFDEALAVAFNDVDLCLRLSEHGWRNVWTPNAELYHHESHTRGSDYGGPRQQEYLRECALLRARWGHLLLADPAYHPALSLDRSDFATYVAPRTS